MVFALQHRVTAVALATLLVATLAGCAPERDPLTATPSPTTPVIVATSDPGTTPPPADAVGTPIPFDCTALISLQQMYDYNPNFLLVPTYTAATDSAAVRAIGYHGLACAWQNTTSNELIVVAVADLPDAELNAIRTERASAATPVTDFGAEAYFVTDGTTGRVDIFSGTHWIVAESPWFLSAADAAPLMTDAIATVMG